MQKKPKLGQNFLSSHTACVAIADALGDVSAKTVVEIGPGKAAITGLLAARAKRLVAIELDRGLAAALRMQFALQPSVDILEQDVLAVDLTGLRQDTEDKLAVVGNLPYYLTSDILLHLFRHHAAISRAVIMVQREVADRIAAAPGTSDYGVLSATTQLYARAEKLLTLPPSAFSPPPDVHSTVLRLTIAPRFAELQVEPAGFIAFLRQCFAQKRKTLRNNLRAAGYEAAQILEAYSHAGIAPEVRAEALPLETTARALSCAAAEIEPALILRRLRHMVEQALPVLLVAAIALLEVIENAFKVPMLAQAIPRRVFGKPGIIFIAQIDGAA